MKDLDTKKKLDDDVDINLVIRNSILLIINLFSKFELKGNILAELGGSERLMYLKKLKSLEY